ncbi:MAG: sensor histidine kinase [Planctomycetota bacterium]
MANPVALQERFFAEAAAQIEESARERLPTSLEVKRLAVLLDQRTGELTAARAKAEIVQRELKEHVRVDHEMRTQSAIMQEKLRRLSHKLLSVQEEERLRISRDLHDAIGQTLTGINVGLATLKHEVADDSRQLAEAITRAQLLVERSMRTVHQFAWELRPTLLDDLGLVPALRSYANLFAKRTGVKVSFAVDAKSYALDNDRSTALFRVAQGALSNVERHSRAKVARVSLRSVAGAVRLEVQDNGKAFDARRMETSKVNKHLGLLVMRERAEMVGGRFAIESSPRRGTTVRADVPLRAVAVLHE